MENLFIFFKCLFYLISFNISLFTHCMKNISSCKGNHKKINPYLMTKCLPRCPRGGVRKTVKGQYISSNKQFCSRKKWSRLLFFCKQATHITKSTKMDHFMHWVHKFCMISKGKTLTLILSKTFFFIFSVLKWKLLKKFPLEFVSVFLLGSLCYILKYDGKKLL